MKFNIFKKTDEAEEPAEAVDFGQLQTQDGVKKTKVVYKKQRQQEICTHGYGYCPQCHGHNDVLGWNT